MPGDDSKSDKPDKPKRPSDRRARDDSSYRGPKRRRGEESRSPEPNFDEDLNYSGPQRRNTDVHIEVLRARLDRMHEDFRDQREDLTRYVLRVELLPLKIVVFGGVAVILLSVLAAVLLTVLKPH